MGWVCSMAGGTVGVPPVLCFCLLHPSSYSLHPSVCTLHPASTILHPVSFILHPAGDRCWGAQADLGCTAGGGAQHGGDPPVHGCTLGGPCPALGARRTGGPWGRGPLGTGAPGGRSRLLPSSAPGPDRAGGVMGGAGKGRGGPGRAAQAGPGGSHEVVLAARRAQSIAVRCAPCPARVLLHRARSVPHHVPCVLCPVLSCPASCVLNPVPFTAYPALSVLSCVLCPACRILSCIACPARCVLPCVACPAL